MERLTFNIGTAREGPLVVAGRHQRSSPKRAPAPQSISTVIAGIR